MEGRGPAAGLGRQSAPHGRPARARPPRRRRGAHPRPTPSSPRSGRSATSCWSTRPARAPAPGGASPRASGALTPGRARRLSAAAGRASSTPPPRRCGPAARWSTPPARCSPRENEARAAAFAARHPDWRAEAAPPPQPARRRRRLLRRPVPRARSARLTRPQLARRNSRAFTFIKPVVESPRLGLDCAADEREGGRCRTRPTAATTTGGDFRAGAVRARGRRAARSARRSPRPGAGRPPRPAGARRRARWSSAATCSRSAPASRRAPRAPRRSGIAHFAELPRAGLRHRPRRPRCSRATPPPRRSARRTRSRLGRGPARQPLPPDPRGAR